MRTRKKSPRRENRIMMEIIVDAYGPEEQAMGWYCYLDDKLGFPFRARCVNERPVSPLRKGEVVEVIGMPDSDECMHEMFVAVRWENRNLAVPLSQLSPTSSTDSETKQAVADWHYWVEQGYEL